jgi:multidrug resistance efflux pump
MFAASLIHSAELSVAKTKLEEAQARHARCLSASLRAQRGEKLRAQGALQSALRELMQAEIDLGKLV